MFKIYFMGRMISKAMIRRAKPNCIKSIMVIPIIKIGILEKVQYFLITRTTVLRSTDFGLNWTSTNWPLGIVRSGTSTHPGGSWSNFNNGQFIFTNQP